MNLREVMARGDPEFPGGEAERRGWFAGYDAAVAEARASADPTSVAGERMRSAAEAVLARWDGSSSKTMVELMDDLREALATNAPDAAKREDRT